MKKITRVLTAVLFALGVISTAIYPAAADQNYLNFKKNQLSKFSTEPAPKNCKLKQKRQGKTLYELCQSNGKALYITVTHGTPMDNDHERYEYKQGKLVQYFYQKGHTAYGFSNNKLVVKWDILNETVDFKLSADDRETEKLILDDSRKALKLFGIQ